MRTLQNLIGGGWRDSASPEAFDLLNPATEEAIARVPGGSPEDVDRAVEAAHRAQSAWAELPVAERVAWIRARADVIAEHAEELAELECREMGKPVALGRSFVEGAVDTLKNSATEALSYEFERTVVVSDDSRVRVLRHPLGAAAVITPWNFPVAMVLGILGPLLAAGNTVVVKPSERSPMAVARLFELLDLPAGVVNLVLGDVRAGQPLAEHERIQLVHFTGSVGAGRRVGAGAGERLHRSVLELGGKDPVVVDAGVDPVATASAVAFGAFVNTGQICTSMERVYVHRAIAAEFVEALVEVAGTYAFGDGRAPDTVLGPLVSEGQRDLVRHHVDDAVQRGATVRTGGVVPERRGFFYPATVLTDVDESMLVMTEETFGPLAPVVVVDSFEEGIERASRSRFGLAATVYTDDPEHMAAAERIPAGVTWVNQWQGGGPEMVYEPAGDSGMGATGARASYDAATRSASVHIAAAPARSTA
ncbi:MULTISPECIES: aldehyde dehydrogenase family protein [unclassified Actinopolyspora]|uniref:aldehyde dehydrogenase family protein n=1 Tax=unclassified Actinopolyspora TaxID=2639451 RepID=UPI0013F60B13|nr:MULTISPECIES: aldehyde dehydrogenase family protein [unclassified Actinopolyspora]NHD19293.1 aldehyde dehydrogenase [Actinopolyspora sp. BKK2]NHE78417.1 aldehyde dehydrogenase [Actinopolyspora sp. BKK1]